MNDVGCGEGGNGAVSPCSLYCIGDCMCVWMWKLATIVKPFGDDMRFAMELTMGH